MALESEDRETLAINLCKLYSANTYTSCLNYLTDVQQQNFPPATALTKNLSVTRKTIEVLCEVPFGDPQHPLIDILNDLTAAGKMDAFEANNLRLIITRVPLRTVAPIYNDLLLNKFAFVNRHELRNILDGMTKPNAPTSILTLKGDPKSGKSYSSLLLKHHCNLTPKTLFCEFRMTDKNLKDVTVERITKDLLQKLKFEGDFDFRRTANSTAWYEDMACEIFKQVNKLLNNETYNQIWFFLDGFSRQRMEHPDYAAETKATSKFLDCFTHKFKDGVMSEHCRLVLSGYGYSLSDECYYSSDTYTTHDVNARDVEETVKNILKSSQAIEAADLVAVTKTSFDEKFGDLAFPLKSLEVLKIPLREIAMKARSHA